MRLCETVCVSVVLVALSALGSLAYGQEPSIEIRARHPGETEDRTLTVEGIEVQDPQPDPTAPIEPAALPGAVDDLTGGVSPTPTGQTAPPENVDSEQPGTAAATDSVDPTVGNTDSSDTAGSPQPPSTPAADGADEEAQVAQSPDESDDSNTGDTRSTDSEGNESKSGGFGAVPIVVLVVVVLGLGLFVWRRKQSR